MIGKSKRFSIFLALGPKCSPICTKEYNPQCGLDGKTYGNPCTMQYAICKSNGKITLAYQGRCSEYIPRLMCLYNQTICH